MINPSLQGPCQALETTAQRGRDKLGGGGGRSSGASCRTLCEEANDLHALPTKKTQLSRKKRGLGFTAQRLAAEVRKASS